MIESENVELYINLTFVIVGIILWVLANYIAKKQNDTPAELKVCTWWRATFIGGLVFVLSIFSTKIYEASRILKKVDLQEIAASSGFIPNSITETLKYLKLDIVCIILLFVIVLGCLWRCYAYLHKKSRSKIGSFIGLLAMILVTNLHGLFVLVVVVTLICKLLYFMASGKVATIKDSDGNTWDVYR